MSSRGVDAGACVICGYSMLGIDSSSPCPECGAVPLPVDASALLATAPEPYLRSLRRGASLLFWAGLIAISFETASFAMEIATAAEAISVPRAGERIISFAIAIVVFGMIAAGIWLMTPLDRRFRTSSELHRLRRPVRLASTVLCSMLIAQFLIELVNAVPGVQRFSVMRALPAGVDQIAFLLWGLTGLASMITALVLLPRYLSELALRGGEPDLTRSTLRRFWYVLLGLPLASIVSIMFVLMLIESRTVAGQLIGQALHSALVIGFIWVVWLSLVHRFRQMLSRFDDSSR